MIIVIVTFAFLAQSTGHILQGSEFSASSVLASSEVWFDSLLDWLTQLRYQIYGGTPDWAVLLFLVALIVIVSSLISLIILIIRAHIVYREQQEIRTKRVIPRDATEHEYLWVFVVPALNEEVVIEDSVGRLSQITVTNKRILVINDGSTDGTADVLSTITDPDLTVLHRTPPEAREGKSEALNAAWRYIHGTILAEGAFAGWNPKKVIVTIVDADGRLDRLAGRIAMHFEDDRVGGVQSQVRIYNRGPFLTTAQDIEFAIFGTVYQLGRMGWGTSNMGGNGQFNRLSALDDVVVRDSKGRLGPWAEGRLTEDQDIGLRMILQGWRGAQASNVSVDQQGVKSLRPLYRQRTRWAQGNWQVFDLVWKSMRNPHLGFIARWDQFWYLMSPLLQVFIGLTIVLTIVFFAIGITTAAMSWIMLVLLYLFSAVPGIVGVMFSHRQGGFKAFLVNILLAHLYLFYSWLIYPVLFRGLLRQVFRRQSWAKTARENLESADNS